MQLVKLLSRYNPLMGRWIKETSLNYWLMKHVPKIIVNLVKEAIIYSVSADPTRMRIV